MDEKQRHWSATEERGSSLGIKLLAFVYRYLGRWLCKLLLVPIIFYFYLSGKVARKASIDYLTKSKANGVNVTPSFWSGFKHFMQFGYSILDKIDVLINHIDLDDLVFEGQEHLDELYNKGQGCILFGSHLGTLEICRTIGRRRRNKRINVLVSTPHANKINQLLKNLDPTVDVDLIQVTEFGVDLAIILKERIELGEMVVIVGDRTSISNFGRVHYVNFIGHPAPFGEGPFVLAGLLDCPVLLLFCLKDDSKFKIIFEPFAQTLKYPRKDRKELLDGAITEYAKRLEYYCGQYPLQWFNFYDFWLEDSKEKLIK
jgi:predicted LPLAT superfamily acyltransferase